MPAQQATRLETLAARPVTNQMDEIDRLRALVVRLTDGLAGDGRVWSAEEIHEFRCEAATVLPSDEVPVWLLPYRTERS